MTFFPRVYRNIREIPSDLFQKKDNGAWLRGRVLSVSDGDTIRWYHAPTRWHSSRIHNNNDNKPEKLSDVTIPIRICTIDTPETAKFGNPGQPYGDVAHNHLSQLLRGKIAYVRFLSMDQYGRAVAEVKTRKMFWSLPFFWSMSYADEYMLKAGLAEVYNGSGAVYGHKGKDYYVQLQTKAQNSKMGMWKQDPREPRESASQYKARIKAATVATNSASV
jgi:endonuclease YncB( thermonuclease family)